MSFFLIYGMAIYGLLFVITYIYIHEIAKNKKFEIIIDLYKIPYPFELSKKNVVKGQTSIMMMMMKI